MQSLYIYCLYTCTHSHITYAFNRGESLAGTAAGLAVTLLAVSPPHKVHIRTLTMRPSVVFGELRAKLGVKKSLIN